MASLTCFLFFNIGIRFLLITSLLSYLGNAAVRRGDVIRCTVLFEKKECKDGKLQVPVEFYENGSKVIPQDKQVTYIEYDQSQLYPYVCFKYANTVLAKVRTSPNFVIK